MREESQGRQSLHLLLFAAGAALFVAGFVVIVAGIPGGAPLAPGSTNATTTGSSATSTPTPTTSTRTTTETTRTTSATGTTTPRTTSVRTSTTTITTTPATTSTTVPPTTTTRSTTTQTTATTTSRKETVDAAVLGFYPDQGSFGVGETVHARVTVENTGTTTHTYFVGFSVYGPDGVERHNGGTTGKAITLEPDEERTVMVAWTVEPDAPVGPYDAQTIVWKEDDPAELRTRLDGAVVETVFWVEASTTTTATHVGTDRGSPVVTAP